MDSKNNIGHSADISLTAELPIPIYNGNTIMDFKKLASLYKDELLDNVLPFWLEHSQDRSTASSILSVGRLSGISQLIFFLKKGCPHIIR